MILLCFKIDVPKLVYRLVSNMTLWLLISLRIFCFKGIFHDIFINIKSMLLVLIILSKYIVRFFFTQGCKGKKASRDK